MDLNRLITSGTKDEIRAKVLMGDYLTVIKDNGDGLIYLLQLTPKPRCILNDFGEYRIIFLDTTKIQSFAPHGYAMNYGYTIMHYEYEGTEIYEAPLSMTQEQLDRILDKYEHTEGTNN